MIASHFVCRRRTSGDKASAAWLESAQGPAASKAVSEKSDIRVVNVIVRLLINSTLFGSDARGGPHCSLLTEGAGCEARREDDDDGIQQRLNEGDSEAWVAGEQLAHGDDRWQAGHVVHGALPGAMQDLLGEVDIRNLVARCPCAVVVARIVAQIDVVGHRLGESHYGEDADEQMFAGHLSSPGSACSGTRSGRRCQ